jgi:Raf kinase inhibitor-like YbhB/YbcL family protein
MKLFIKDFVNKDNKIKKKYICKNHDGQNISPYIEWTSIKDVKSYALILEDPDAVSGNFVHWYIPYISPDINGIDNLIMINSIKNISNKAHLKQGKNSLNEFGYHGPCAPKGSGVHRYIFRIYSLDNILNFDKYKSISGSTEFEEILKKESITILDTDSSIFNYSYSNKNV